MSEDISGPDGITPFSAIEEYHGAIRIESDKDIALRKELADRGNFTFVGQFNEGNVAWAATETNQYHPFQQAVLLDRDGVLVTDEDYSSPGNFSEGLAVTSKGYIDSAGKLLLPEGNFHTLTLNIGDGDFNNGLAAVQLSNTYFDGLFSYINHDGVLITNDKFSIANPFSDGLAAVREDQYYGYIDTEGNWVKRDLAHTSSFNNGVASIQEGFTEPFFIIDKDGKRILTDVPVICIGPFSEGFAWATDGKQLILMDKNGKVRLKANDYVGGTPGAPDSYLSRLPNPLRNGMSRVKFIEGSQTLNPSAISRKRDGEGFIDLSNRRYGPYRSVGQFIDGFGYVEAGNKYQGTKKYMIDQNGQKVPEFHEREYEGEIKRSIGDTVHDIGWRWRNRKRK